MLAAGWHPAATGRRADLAIGDITGRRADLAIGDITGKGAFTRVAVHQPGAARAARRDADSIPAISGVHRGARAGVPRPHRAEGAHGGEGVYLDALPARCSVG